MTDIQNTTGESAREKRPTVLKGLFFLIILLLVCGGLVIAATQLRSKEGPKVATLAPTPMAVTIAPTLTVALSPSTRCASFPSSRTRSRQAVWD